MAYLRQNFEDGQVLTHEHLNHIEDGIVDIVGSIENIPYTLSQGYATDKEINTSNATRVKTNFIHGSFSIKLKAGYVIRAIYTYDSESVSNGVEVLANGTTLTSYNLNNTGRYAIITFASASNASASISPTAEIIESLTTYNPINNNNNGGSSGCHVIKRAVFFGDSITHGVFSYYEDDGNGGKLRKNGFDTTDDGHPRIPAYFGEMANCEVTNHGKRGSGWIVDTRNIGNAWEMCQKTDFSQYDFAAFCLGINDYIQGATLGSLDDLKNPGGAIGGGDVTSNMVACFQKVFSENPLCKVVVYSPYNTWGQYSQGGDYTSDTLYGDETTNYALGADNKAGYTLQELIDHIDKVCKHYGIRHVKLSESNVCNRFTIKDIMIDGLHPSRESRPMLAAEIFGQKGYDF